MNTTPKTDECIKMLGEAQTVFRPLFYSSKGRFDKNNVIDWQNRIRAMLDYRLMPFGVISIPDNADKNTAMDNPILQNISNFDAFWYAMKNYQLVTLDDLRNEFWSICPDLESIPKFLNVMNVKFNDVNCRYDEGIDTIKEHYNGLNELVKAIKLSEKESDDIFYNIKFIAERYNFIMDCIRDMYKTFRKMAENNQIDTTTGTKKHLPQQITIPDNILNELQKQGIIEDATVRPLKWLKSKALLAYFVEVANTTLKLEKGEKRQIRPFETMFNEAGISGAINDYKKTGTLPINHEIINKIFE